MKVTYEGEVYDFDMDEMTVVQAKMIKTDTGLTLAGLEEGLEVGDPDALRALFWLMLVNSGHKVNLGQVDFKIVKFATALQEAVAEREKAEKEAEKQGKTPRTRANPTT